MNLRAIPLVLHSFYEEFGRIGVTLYATNNNRSVDVNAEFSIREWDRDDLLIEREVMEVVVGAFMERASLRSGLREIGAARPSMNKILPWRCFRT